MAKGDRRQYSVAEEVALVAQVDGKCPLCGEQLFYKKKGRTQKVFELAHIYPLNPKQEEVSELSSAPRLHDDVNDPDNLIPLCPTCHEKFDKPRTAEEYRQLFALKRACLDHAKQQELQVAYYLEADIAKVIDALYTDDPAAQLLDLEYKPKKVDDKIADGISLPTRHKIKHNVGDYYGFIKRKFLQIERENPGSSDLIYSQVKTFYLGQRALGLSKQEIFSNIVAWFYERAKPPTVEAAEIVTAFFVQNCEVFE